MPVAQFGQRREPDIALDDDLAERCKLAGQIATAPVGDPATARHAVETDQLRQANTQPTAVHTDLGRLPPDAVGAVGDGVDDWAAPSPRGVATSIRCTRHPVSSSTKPAAILVPPTSTPIAVRLICPQPARRPGSRHCGRMRQWWQASRLRIRAPRQGVKGLPLARTPRQSSWQPSTRRQSYRSPPSRRTAAPRRWP